jgi:hypothetical protein
MLKTQFVAPGVLKIIAPEKLDADDFADLTPEIESVIKSQGKISLLIDASRLNGWTNLTALEKHAGFVKDNEHQVERVAVIAGHEWQHWLVGAVKVFLHPQVKVFDKGEADEALRWITD